MATSHWFGNCSEACPMAQEMIDAGGYTEYGAASQGNASSCGCEEMRGLRYDRTIYDIRSWRKATTHGFVSELEFFQRIKGDE
jgi:hypothetical protein